MSAASAEADEAALMIAAAGAAGRGNDAVNPAMVTAPSMAARRDRTPKGMVPGKPVASPPERVVEDRGMGWAFGRRATARR